MEHIHVQQYGRFMPADIQTPISLYLGLVGEGEGILFESAEVDGRLGRYSLIAWDFRLVLACRNGKLDPLVMDERFAPLHALAGMDYIEGVRAALDVLVVDGPQGEGFDNLPPITRALYGYMGYGVAAHFEEKLAATVPVEDAEACLVLPGHVVLYDHLHHRCCHLALDENAEPPALDTHAINRRAPAPRVGEITTDPGREEYIAGVLKAKEMLHAGEGIQVVLSTRFSAPFSGDPFVVYRRLRQINPSPYMFYMKLPSTTLIGSSPELMLRSERGRLEVRPIAGTRPRGASVAEDEALAADLLADPKERAEHVMLVDLGRNDLGRVAAPGTVEVLQFMNVERFSHVMHITSYVEADLADGLTALDGFGSAFPAGTLSGAPKVRAMEMIQEIEQRPRGPYGGAVAWLGLQSTTTDEDGETLINTDGLLDLDSGIIIRSMWVQDGRVYWQAGAGIVHDSVPQSEWQECQNKARVIRKALATGEAGDVFAD